MMCINFLISINFFLIGLLYGSESNVTGGILTNVFHLFPSDTFEFALHNLLQPWPDSQPMLVLSPFNIISDLANIDNKCGRIRSKRASGGRNANYGEIPWQVQLIKYLNNTPIRQCSGALIGNKWIISTADCGYKKHHIKAFIGTPYNSFTKHFNISNSSAKFVRVLHPIIHPQYDKISNKYNIALYYFNASIESNEVIPVCLPRTHEKFIGMKGQMSGWGEYVYKTNGIRFKRNGSHLIGYVFTKTVSKNLKVLELPILSRTQCAKGSFGEHIKGIRLEETQFCAFSTRLKGLCPNDIGAPMTIKKGVHKLVGLGVMPLECTNVWKASKPSVFINVAYFRNWIDSTIRSFEQKLLKAN